MAHRLDITPGTSDGMAFHGKLTFDDGTTVDVYGSDRARCIARAQEAIEQFGRVREITPETLMLDDAGEIIREPIEWTVRS